MISITGLRSLKGLPGSLMAPFEGLMGPLEMPNEGHE